ncbi:MAG: hypothetical protein CSB33_01750 [Desulfobacterales bacterium]|nr:MAG: hypothetical protein CSB33_01750 [Desulfobacterales bacterium]
MPDTLTGILSEPIDLIVYPCLRDHAFNPGGPGTHRTLEAVYPAVEAMQVLGTAVYRMHSLEGECIRIRNARFGKFLPLPVNTDRISALLEISPETDGWAAARLCSRKQAGSAGMIRRLVHAEMEFRVGKNTEAQEPAEIEPASSAMEPASGGGSPEFVIPAARLYGELVPFGPLFHHLTGDIRLYETGAGAEGVAPGHITAPGLLGSPFPLDAAFHCACAWGQRHAGLVAFPTGFAGRRNLRPVHPGASFRLCVMITESGPDRIVCDMAVFLEDGGLADEVTGLLMKDVSGGRWKPPEWIRIKKQ